MTHYDLVVLGAGSGNTIVDDRFSDRRVAIVERDRYGGTCLNRGCIPSKMLVLPADLADDAADGARVQLHTRFDGVDWPALRDRVFGRLDSIADAGREYRDGLPFVDALMGSARFTGPKSLRVDLADGGTADLTADQIVIATGSRPVVPDIPGLADVDPYTSDDVMRIDELPRRLGILGGGYVGCELAHVFAAFGSEVVQVEAEDALLAAQDDDVARVFTQQARKRWDVRLGTKLTEVNRTDDGIVLHLDNGETATVDAVLVAIGRRTNNDQLGLAGTGIEVDSRNRIVVDEYQRAGVDGVWALGDASSPQPLKHVANQDARVVQHNLLHPDAMVESDHSHVPYAVFSSPQVAAVGLTERAARARGIDVAVGVTEYSSTAWGWALHDEESGDFCKVIAERSTGLLVGAHLVGPQAATLIQPLIQAMTYGRPVQGLARGQYWIHPAPTEVVENTLLAVEKQLDVTAAPTLRTWPDTD